MSYPPSFHTHPASVSHATEVLGDDPQPPAPSYRSPSPSAESQPISQYYRSELTIGNPGPSFLRLFYDTRKGMSISPDTHVVIIFRIMYDGALIHIPGTGKHHKACVQYTGSSRACPVHGTTGIPEREARD